MPEFVHGHGVVFPDCDYAPGADPVSAPRELVIDARDLAGNVTARVEALFRAWGKGRPAAPLTKRWVKRLGQQVLAPHFSLTLALGSALGWEEKALALLHEEQDVCLDFLHLNPRALVRGGAGTGKGGGRSRTTCGPSALRGRGSPGRCGPARTTSSARSCARGPGWRGTSRRTT